MMPCRNDSWVLGLSARAALLWCDALVILDHASTDVSREIMAQLVAGFPDRIALMTDSNPDWDEMRHREAMLRRARVEGATHMAIIDADEILTSNLIPYLPGSDIGQYPQLLSIRGYIANMPHGSILQLPLYNMRGGITKYHSNGMWGQRWVSVAFADDKRLHWGGEQYHHREPMGMTLSSYRPLNQGQGGCLHLWGASERRLIAKHRAYRITERIRWPNKPAHEIESLYSMATEGRPQHGDVPARWTYADVPANWWYPDLMKYLDVDAEPWQTSYVDEMIELHGRDRFAGLKV